MMFLRLNIVRECYTVDLDIKDTFASQTSGCYTVEPGYKGHLRVTD